MSDDPLVIDISAKATLPDDRPQRGARRVVKLLPTPWGVYAPCLWRSPVIMKEGGVAGRWCVSLITKTGELGKPQTAAMFVPDALWDKLPEDIVEW